MEAYLLFTARGEVVDPAWPGRDRAQGWPQCMRPACPGAESQPLDFHMTGLPVGGLILGRIDFDNIKKL